MISLNESRFGAVPHLFAQPSLCGSNRTTLGVIRPRGLYDIFVPQDQEGRPSRGGVGEHDERGQSGQKSLVVPGSIPGPAGQARTLTEGQEAMGIDWMPWKPLTQAIPPAFSHWIGTWMEQHMQEAAA